MMLMFPVSRPAAIMYFIAVSPKKNFAKANFVYFVSRPYDEKLAQRYLLKEYGILKALEL